MKNERSSVKKRLRVVGFVQARMTSSRLPGKVLMDLVGKPVVQRIIQRLQAAREVDETVLMITTQKEDDQLAALGEHLGVSVYRSENERLLDGYHDLAHAYSADAIVCITCDCPFVDPDHVDVLVKVFREKPDAYDLVTNVLPSTWPDGLDIFVYPTAILDYFYAHRDSMYQYPVTFNFSKNPKQYRVYNQKNDTDLSPLRWTLDYPEDLELVRKVYAALFPKKFLFKTPDILQLIKEHPELMDINANRADPTHGWGDNIKAFLDTSRKKAA